MFSETSVWLHYLKQLSPFFGFIFLSHFCFHWLSGTAVWTHDGLMGWINSSYLRCHFPPGPNISPNRTFNRCGRAKFATFHLHLSRAEIRTHASSTLNFQQNFPTELYTGCPFLERFTNYASHRDRGLAKCRGTPARLSQWMHFNAGGILVHAKGAHFVK